MVVSQPQLTSTVTQSSSDFYIVGIGASAGGLHPLENFFESLLPNTGACFVVVQHLSPDFKSLMKELLERRTRMAIFKVEDGMVPTPNAIYLIPPGQNLVIRDRQFHLTSQQRKASAPAPQYPINFFLESLAADCGERAIGIILSGTGTDGTRGLQAINEVGGLTLVQAPSSAEFDGMPNSAIETQIIDQILPPEQLAHSIAHLLSTPKIIPGLRSEANHNTLAAPYMEQIIRILADEGQVDFSYYKENTLSRRIHRRCLATGFPSLEEYIEHLRDSEEERLTLRSDLLIKVTHFFRNPEAWKFLENQVMPGLIDIMEPANPLRLWSAACATGEEAYSLAILIHELADHANRPVHAKIFATDLDQSALDKASQGIYSDAIRNDLPERYLKKYFVQRGDSFEIKRHIREMVIFANHNLVYDAGFTRLHLVSCRNVLIYMQAQLQQKVIRSLNFSLRQNGILFLGESENLGDLESAFVTLNQRGKIYQKFRGTGLLNLPMMNNRAPVVSGRLPAVPVSKSSLDPILEATLRGLVTRKGLTCLVVDRHNDLIHVAGGSADILLVPEGRISNKLSDRVVPSLRLPLTTAIGRARRAEEDGISYRGIALREQEPCRLIKLDVWQQKGNAVVGDCVIVLIETDSPEPTPSNAQDGTSQEGNSPDSSFQSSVPLFELNQEASNRVSEVEYELQQTRENLQATIEELETTNEEQQATNEELIASNEELQSTNEELHSVNEELYTVNSEYQSKIQELLQLNSDIDNLLESTEIGVVFLAKDLTVRKFTPAARMVFRLVPSDLGRPIGDLAHNMEIDNFEELIHSVIESGQHSNLDIKLPGDSKNEADKHLLMRLHPYRGTTQEADGIVISLVDISLLKETEGELRDAQAQLIASNAALEHRVEERTHRLQAYSNNLQQLYQIKASHYDSELELLEAYLETGCSILGLSEASLLCWEAEQLTLKAAITTGISLETGQVFPHSLDGSWLPWDNETRTVGYAEGDAIQLDGHPLYEDAVVQVYFAAQLKIGGENVGVLEFVSLKARDTPVELYEVEVLELLASSLAEVIARLRANAILVEREATYRKLYNETPAMLHSIDPRGRLLGVSDYWLRKMGYSRDEVIGRKSTEFLTPESQDYAKRVVLPEFSKSGSCWDVPYQFVRKDGGIIDVLLSAASERDESGDITSSLVVLVDVTESRRLQQELQQAQALAQAKSTADVANRAKSRFLASISHELRTPLNSILGFSELLSRDDALTADHQEQISTIRRAGAHLLSLINNVLDLSKIEADQIALVNTHFDLYALLEQEIWSLFHQQVSSKGLQFEILRENALPQYICTDPTRLRQILINLLDNAIKFTHSGQVTLRVSAMPLLAVSATHTEPQTQLLRFVVADTGSGIDAQLVDHIFEAFTQDGKRTNPEGAGLGLNISQRLAMLLGGNISVESQQGSGSTFTLTLPVQISDQVGSINTATAEILGLAPEQATPRILVVEDNPDNQKYLVSLLEKAGFICKGIDDGAGVIEAWQDWQPDLIFMDIQLPNRDGKEIICEIKSTPEGKQTPLVVLTASTFKQQEIEIIATGCDGYLRKPVHPAEVFNELQRHLPVRYIYSNDSTKAMEQIVESNSLDLSIPPLEDFGPLPEGWLLEFHHAVATGATNQMRQSIALLPPAFSHLSRCLEHRVSQYQLQELLSWTTSLCNRIEM